MSLLEITNLSKKFGGFSALSNIDLKVEQGTVHGIIGPNGSGKSTLFNAIGSDTNPMFAMPWYWHLVLGGFAFGMMFMATDPVTAAHTGTGKWIYGFLIGVFTVLIRVFNPAYPEGIMLAILLMNVFAPLIDYFVINANKKRKLSWVIVLVISAFILFKYSFKGEYTNAEFGFLRCIYLFILGFLFILNNFL